MAKLDPLVPIGATPNNLGPSLFMIGGSFLLPLLLGSPILLLGLRQFCRADGSPVVPAWPGPVLRMLVRRPSDAIRFNQGDGVGRAADERLVAEARRRVVELVPGTLRNWLQKVAVLIDLRDTEAFGAGPIAKPIPLNCAELALTSEQLVPDLPTPIACRCDRGNRRALAVDQWQQLG